MLTKKGPMPTRDQQFRGLRPRNATGKWFVPYAIDWLTMTALRKILKTNQQTVFHMAIALLAEKVNAEHAALGHPIRVEPSEFTKDQYLGNPRLYHRPTSQEEMVRHALEQRFSPEDLERLGYRFEREEVDPGPYRDLVRFAISCDGAGSPEQAGGGRAGDPVGPGEAGHYAEGDTHARRLAGSPQEEAR